MLPEYHFLVSMKRSRAYPPLGNNSASYVVARQKKRPERKWPLALALALAVYFVTVVYPLVSKARCLIRRHLQPLYIEAPADEADLCTRPGTAMSISWCLAILLNKGENWHAD